MKLMNKCGDLNKVQLIYFRKLQYTVGWDILVNIVFIWSGLKINPWISKSDVVSLCTSTYKILQQKWDFLLKYTADAEKPGQEFSFICRLKPSCNFYSLSFNDREFVKTFLHCFTQLKVLLSWECAWLLKKMKNLFGKVFVLAFVLTYLQDTHNLYKKCSK